MFLAPTPHLSATLRPLLNGNAGIRQTVDCMRAMVRAYRTDPAIIQAARSAVFLTPERDELSEVLALFSYVQQGVRYVRDIHEVETLSTPDKVMQSQVGDCDDQSTLLATLLESIGYPTRFVVAGYDTPGAFSHVYLQVFAGGDWIDLDPTESHPMGWAPPQPVALMIERV